jgi:hypothetical protein
MLVAVLIRVAVVGRSGFAMQRLIASSLLVVFLAGILAPAAMALSQDLPHACCLRKASHCHGDVQAEPALSSGGCAQHSCCRSLAVRQWAQPALPLRVAEKRDSEHRASLPNHLLKTLAVAESHSGRAPPAFAIA